MRPNLSSRLALFAVVLTLSQNRCEGTNVLFIAIDDLRPELGCYDAPAAISPNLDAMADQGVLFRNHFVQVPTCGASRYALLTGRSPRRSGVTSNNHAFYRGDSALTHRALSASQSMPEMFRRNGYHTVCIGKLSHTADGRVFQYDGRGNGRDEVPHAWDELATPFGPWKRGWGIFFAYRGGRHREDGQGHRDLMEFQAERDDELPDGLLAEAAMAKLTDLKAAGKPFFLGLGFFKPHLPFVATQGDWQAVEQVPPVANPEPIDSPYWHRSGEFYKYDMPFQKSRPLPPQSAALARRAYLACVRYTDRQVGKVLHHLEELGLSDSTIVVVWGDHGWFLGEVGLWGKHTPLERAVRSALIVRAPGVSQTGVKTDALVESIDLYPTLSQLCALSYQATRYPLDGIDLTELLSGRMTSVRGQATSYWRDAISLRTQQYRLIFRGTIDEPRDVELYDIRQSPDPLRNLAAERPDVVQRMLSNY